MRAKEIKKGSILYFRDYPKDITVHAKDYIPCKICNNKTYNELLTDISFTPACSIKCAKLICMSKIELFMEEIK